MHNCSKLGDAIIKDQALYRFRIHEVDVRLKGWIELINCEFYIVSRKGTIIKEADG